MEATSLRLCLTSSLRAQKCSSASFTNWHLFRENVSGTEEEEVGEEERREKTEHSLPSRPAWRHLPTMKRSSLPHISASVRAELPDPLESTPQCSSIVKPEGNDLWNRNLNLWVGMEASLRGGAKREGGLLVAALVVAGKQQGGIGLLLLSIRSSPHLLKSRSELVLVCGDFPEPNTTPPSVSPSPSFATPYSPPSISSVSLEGRLVRNH